MRVDCGGEVMARHLMDQPSVRMQVKAELCDRGLIAPDARWAPLSGGRTNALWRVSGGARDLVVKLYPPDRQTPLFRNDGIAEAAVLTALSGMGMSPDLHASTTTALGPCVIYDFAAGAAWSDDPMPVARILKRLHGTEVDLSLPAAPSGSAALRAQGEAMLAQCSGALVQTLRRRMPGDVVVPSVQDCLLHGDVVASNVIQSEDGLRLIDWQCPMRGEPAADIAIFLSPAMQALYGGTPPTALFQAAFFAAYGCPEAEVRYRALAPWYHWRMAAYCLWKAERGAVDYRDALGLELAALENCG